MIVDIYPYNTYGQIQELREKIREVRKHANERDRGAYDAIDQLETDLGRVLLKLHAAVAVLVDKGLVTEEELAAKSRELDAADGVVDGALHPAYFRTKEENERPLTTEAYLNKLQSMNVESPKEFLARLESDSTGPA